MSTREPTTLKLADRTYIIGDWDVDKALETFVWLTKNFGEGIMSLFMSKDGLETAGKVASGEDEDEDNEEAIMAFMNKVLKNLEPKEYVKYSKIIVDGCRCDGSAIDFKFHFVGRMGELHRLMFAILKHQYSDFLDGGDGVGFL